MPLEREGGQAQFIVYEPPASAATLECCVLPIDARIAKDPSGAERRGQPRADVVLDAHVREMGTTGTEARVLNISRDGFMAQTGDVEFGKRDALAEGRAGTGGSDLPDLPAE